MTSQQLEPWPGTRLLHKLPDGYRNEAHLCERGGELVVAKTTRRSEAAMVWLLPVQRTARLSGFVVPEFIRSENGHMLENGVTLEAFIEGEAVPKKRLPFIETHLKAFHHLTSETAQRPGFASAEALLTVTSGGDVDLTLMPADLVTRCREAWLPLKGEVELA